MGRLVLSRKQRQSIAIGPEIVVYVSQIRGNQVRLAIDAPPAVRIVRTEIGNSKQRSVA